MTDFIVVQNLDDLNNVEIVVLESDSKFWDLNFQLISVHLSMEAAQDAKKVFMQREFS